MYYNLIYPNLNFAHKEDEGPSFAEVFEKHFHLIYEILYLVDGDVDLVVENMHFHMNPGDLAFIQPGQFHYVVPNPKRRYERYVLKFPEYKIPDDILSTIKEKPICASVKDTILPEIFSHMDWHYEKYVGGNIDLIMESLLTVVITYFCAQDGMTDGHVKYLNKNITDIIEFINENIAEPLQIEDICEHFHYSKSYICKEFLKSMNVPIMKYIRSKKVLLADSLIKTGLKPTQVFSQCGFSDYSTFYRNYTKVIGKPPSSYDVSHPVYSVMDMKPEEDS